MNQALNNVIVPIHNYLLSIDYYLNSMEKYSRAFLMFTWDLKIYFNFAF